MGVGTASALVLCALGLSSTTSLLGSIFTFGSSSDPDDGLRDALARHEQLALVDSKRFTGRSPFFPPQPPVRKAPKPVKVEPPPPPPPPPPPSAPRDYTGPKPIAAVGSTVFFADNSQIRVGEEKGGVKVLGTSIPWSVKLAHAGGEYDVPLWSKGKEEFFNGDWSSLKGSVPGIQTVTPSKAPGSANADPAGTSGSDGAGMPGMRSGPGMGGSPATPPQPPAANPGPDSSQAAASPPPPPQSSGERNPWTSEHMAPPPPITPEALATMSKADVQSALQAVSRSRMNRNLDASTRERLNQEFLQLSNRMNELAKGQSGPG